MVSGVPTEWGSTELRRFFEKFGQAAHVVVSLNYSLLVLLATCYFSTYCLLLTTYSTRHFLQVVHVGVSLNYRELILRIKEAKELRVTHTEVQFATCCLLFTSSCLLLATCFWLLAAHCSLLSTHCTPLTAHNIIPRLGISGAARGDGEYVAQGGGCPRAAARLLFASSR